MVAGDSGYSSRWNRNLCFGASALTGLRAWFPSKLSRLTGNCSASKNYSARPAARPPYGTRGTIPGAPERLTHPDIFNSYTAIPTVFPSCGLNAGDALESRHDWRDADGLRHQVGDLDSGNASGITARIDGCLRNVSSSGAQSPAAGAYLVNLTVPDRPLGRRGFLQSG